MICKMDLYQKPCSFSYLLVDLHHSLLWVPFHSDHFPVVMKVGDCLDVRALYHTDSHRISYLRVVLDHSTARSRLSTAEDEKKTGIYRLGNLVVVGCCSRRSSDNLVVLSEYLRLVRILHCVCLVLHCRSLLGCRMWQDCRMTCFHSVE